MITTDGGAAQARQVAQATKASGVIIRVRPKDFPGIVGRQEEPLVVHAETGVFSKKHQYLAGYKGLAFVTKNDTRLNLPADAERVEADKIWLPD